MIDRNAPSAKSARARLAARYLVALRRCLDPKRPRRDDRRAQCLGRLAVAGGLVTLDLAIMHEKAVVALAPTHDFARTANGALQRAGLFFTQALAPLEAARRVTREAIAHLHQRNETLHLHAAALAKGNRQLVREVARRRAGELAIIQGREKYRALLQESLVMQQKLRLLTRQILSAQEEERKEISRELHDEVVQTLVSINVELAALGKGASASLRGLKAKIARTQRLVETSMSEVHRFARELRPAVLDDLGLIPALDAYSKNLAARKKLKIQMTAFGGVEALGSTKRTVLFRVAQEALTNVARHAQATQVRMTISEVAGAIRMEISDNGRSFPVGETLSARNPKRLGLVGMRERVEMVGGRLTIESAPGLGTTVRAEIPINQGRTSA